MLMHKIVSNPKLNHATEVVAGYRNRELGALRFVK